MVFYLLSMAAHYIRMINRRYPSFLISLVIFSLYVSYFATRENRSAQNNAQMLYARILGTVPQDRILRNDVAGATSGTSTTVSGISPTLACGTTGSPFSTVTGMTTRP